MKINIAISPALAEYSRVTSAELDTAEVRAALEAIGIPLREVGFVMVNGRICTLDTCLSDNDTLEIYPCIIDG